MLRLKPTVISLTAGEVKDAETRRRFRRHLKRADAQLSTERKRAEQDRILLPRRRSSSVSDTQAKEGPDHAATQEPEGVLASSPPQSLVTPAQQPATAPLASPHGPEQHASDDQEPKVVQEQPPLAPRLLAMTPRRFPHALGSASSQRRGSGHGRYAGPTAVPITSLSAQPHNASDMAGNSDTGHPVEPPTSPTRDSTSPIIPPPFSQTPRRITADYTASMSANISGNPNSADDHTKATVTNRTPPVTPVRRSSLSATSRVQGIFDEQGYSSSTHPLERDAERGHTHTPSRRIRSSAGHAKIVPSTPNSPSDIGEAEATTSYAAARLSRIQIYNDSLPRSGQPETPQNLPEARHQSRLRGSYTVPARHGTHQDIATPTTSRRRRQHSRLNPTPAGLQTPGFLGLYGGIENSDEVTLFEEAERDFELRASRAEHGSSFSF